MTYGGYNKELGIFSDFVFAQCMQVSIEMVRDLEGREVRQLCVVLQGESVHSGRVTVVITSTEAETRVWHTSSSRAPRNSCAEENSHTWLTPNRVELFIWCHIYGCKFKQSEVPEYRENQMKLL